MCREMSEIFLVGKRLRSTDPNNHPAPFIGRLRFRESFYPRKLSAKTSGKPAELFDHRRLTTPRAYNTLTFINRAFSRPSSGFIISRGAATARATRAHRHPRGKPPRFLNRTANRIGTNFYTKPRIWSAIRVKEIFRSDHQCGRCGVANRARAFDM